MATPSSAPRVACDTRAAWREWLLANSERESAVWLVSWKKATGRPSVSYGDAVAEALCVGWVDSTGRKLDHERTMLYFARRRPTSGWSRSNKLRIEALRRDGLMTPAGERAVAEAERNGAWILLDEVEKLTVPDDLGEAFGPYPDAGRNWEGFPPSVRRGILEWIVQAKRPDTRAKRIAETARLAETNDRAHQWRPPDNAGPPIDG